MVAMSRKLDIRGCDIMLNDMRLAKSFINNSHKVIPFIHNMKMKNYDKILVCDYKSLLNKASLLILIYCCISPCVSSLLSCNFMLMILWELPGINFG